MQPGNSLIRSEAECSRSQGVKRNAADYSPEEYHEALLRVSQLVASNGKAAGTVQKRSSVFFAAVLKALLALLTQVCMCTLLSTPSCLLAADDSLLAQAKVRVPAPPDWLVGALHSLIAHGASVSLSTPQGMAPHGISRPRYTPPHMRQVSPAGAGMHTPMHAHASHAGLHSHHLSWCNPVCGSRLQTLLLACAASDLGCIVCRPAMEEWIRERGKRCGASRGSRLQLSRSSPAVSFAVPAGAVLCCRQDSHQRHYELGHNIQPRHMRAVQALGRTNSKSLHGHWSSLMAWHNSLAGLRPSIVDLMLLDPSPKVSNNTFKARACDHGGDSLRTRGRAAVPVLLNNHARPHSRDFKGISLPVNVWVQVQTCAAATLSILLDGAPQRAFLAVAELHDLGQSTSRYASLRSRT